MAYYYLVAQLPCLLFGQKPPMSAGDFKEMAKTLMEEKDAVFMDSLSIGDIKDNAEGTTESIAEYTANKTTGCDFLDNWQDWERTLRLNLAKQRAIKIKRDMPVEAPVYSVEPAAAAAKAIDEYSPLEGELILDKARWNAVNNFAGSDYFNRNIIYAYYLKLLLLERRQSFDADKGFAEYKSLYSSIINNFENEQKAAELQRNSLPSETSLGVQQ